MLSRDFFLNKLELVVVHDRVANHVAEKSDSAANITLHNLSCDVTGFAASFASELSTHISPFFPDLSLGALRSASLHHLLEDVVSACGLKILVSGTSSNKDTDGSKVRRVVLCANSDTVRKSRDLYNYI